MPAPSPSGSLRSARSIRSTRSTTPPPTIAALADFRVALILIDDHGLDFDAVEQWIADMTARAVLDRDVMDA